MSEHLNKLLHFYTPRGTANSIWMDLMDWRVESLDVIRRFFCNNFSNLTFVAVHCLSPFTSLDKSRVNLSLHRCRYSNFKESIVILYNVSPRQKKNRLHFISSNHFCWLILDRKIIFLKKQASAKRFPTTNAKSF